MKADHESRYEKFPVNSLFGKKFPVREEIIPCFPPEQGTGANI
jgi:hypothetical protein